MKTQIIQLNQSDDLVSVKDKMSACQTGRILLVWPSHGHVLNRLLDLNLVKRFAARLGAQLALSTHDADVRYYARDLGILVVNDPRQALEQEWQLRRDTPVKYRPRVHSPEQSSLRRSVQSKTKPWWEHPAARIIYLGLSFLALIALGLFFLPGVKVIINPQKEVQSVSLELVADPSATTYNLTTGTVPTFSQETTVEGTETSTTTGTTMLPVRPASGTLKFTNNGKIEIILPARTIVTTLGNDRVRFMTASVDELAIKPNKSVMLEAVALKSGLSGNLSPNRLVAIEGPIGLDLIVTNPEATSGGQAISVPAPTSQDLEAIRQRLTKRLIQTAVTQLQANLPGDDSLIPASAVIVDVLDETINPQVGQPGERVELTQRLKIKVQAVTGENLRNMVIPLLDSSMPSGYSPVMDSLLISAQGSSVMGLDGKAYWTVNAQRSILAEIPINQVVDSIKGSTAAEAAARISKLMPLAEQVQIRIAPTWWPRLPFLSMHITLVQADAQ